MKRIALLILFAAFIHVTVKAQPAFDDWSAVERLPLGARIDVIERGGHPTPCRINMTDDNTLTCIVSSPYAPPQRIVFPFASIAAIYVLEPHKGFSLKGVLITTATFAGVGGAIGARGGGGTAAIGALLCGVVGANVALDDSPGRYPMPPQRRLVYRVP
jgi:hypothetical protein